MDGQTNSTGSFSELEIQNEDQLIDELGIYDRWGKKVFSQENFVPSDQSSAWDGTYDGRKIKKGVYIYQFS